jgi:hypothetical protein
MRPSFGHLPRGALQCSDSARTALDSDSPHAHAHSHPPLSQRAQEIIDPDFWYANFTEAEQSKILKAGRCNNNLATAKLQAAVPDIAIPNVKDSMRNVFLRMKDNLIKEGNFPPPPRKGPKPTDVTTF